MVEFPSPESVRPRALLVTLLPGGGVGALAEVAAAWLGARGFAVSMAWYEPWRRRPELSVPFWALPFRRPRMESERRGDGVTLYRVGVRLPELEALRYRRDRLWRRLVERHDIAIAVCGSVLQAGPLAGRGQPVLAWVSTAFDSDRAQRRRRFSWPRRLFDRLVDAPLCRRQERRLLAQVAVLTNSRPTARDLARRQPALDLRAVLPWPLAGDLAPAPWPRDESGLRRIGFCGRLNDPRKNLPLLLSAFARLRDGRPWLRLSLAGEAPAEPLRAEARRLGIEAAVEWRGRLSREDLLAFYRALELFVIPSQQEGLGIVGLEAMATGRPVVSTRCGGPADFVVPGETGALVEQDPAALADALGALLDDPAGAEAMGRRAAAFVERHYGEAALAARFHAACDAVLGARRALPADGSGETAA